MAKSPAILLFILWAAPLVELQEITWYTVNKAVGFLGGIGKYFPEISSSSDTGKSLIRSVAQKANFEQYVEGNLLKNVCRAWARFGTIVTQQFIISYNGNSDGYHWTACNRMYGTEIHSFPAIADIAAARGYDKEAMTKVMDMVQGEMQLNSEIKHSIVAAKAVDKPAMVVFCHHLLSKLNMVEFDDKEQKCLFACGAVLKPTN